MVFIIGSPVNCRLLPTGILLDAVAVSLVPFADCGERILGGDQGSVEGFQVVKHGFGKEVAGRGGFGNS
jgi:hypothetical protein